jgi:hypothetical protein
MCDRIAGLVQALPGSAATDRAMEQIRHLAQKMGRGRGLADALIAPNANAATDFPTLEQLRSCEVCQDVNNALWQFLCRFQYDLIVSSDVRNCFAERSGLCAPHIWQYQSVASPYGTCAGFPPLFVKLAAALRYCASAAARQGTVSMKMPGLPAQEHCVACTVRAKAEEKAIAALAKQFAQDDKQAIKSLSAICLPHFTMLSSAIENSRVVCKLMDHHAALLERLSEDMQRYALKHNATRRYLESQEETTAAERALLFLAGHRNVNTALTAYADAAITSGRKNASSSCDESAKPPVGDRG